MSTLRTIGVTFASALVLLAGCADPVKSLNSFDTSGSNYLVTVRSGIANGSVTVSPTHGVTGTHINIVVNPQPGYILKTDSLRYYSAPDQSSSIDPSVHSFELAKSNIIVSADFVQAPHGIYTVTTSTSGSGSLAVSTLSGIAGNTVTVDVLPDPGYGLSSAGLLVNGVEVSGPPYKFSLAAANATVTAVFEKKDLNALVLAGRGFLTASSYDAAFASYEAAYQLDNRNTEAAVYSTVGQLASILTDTKVRNILSKINLARIPSSLTGWVSGSSVNDSQRWVESYYDNDSDHGARTNEHIWPRLNPPTGIPQTYINSSFYQNNVQNGYSHTPLFWSELLWNTISNNRDGLNDLLDDSRNALFGPKFLDAMARASTVPYGVTVPLNVNMKQQLGLDKLLGTSKTTIGRAELDLLIGSLLVLKAGVEWASAYDWQTDMNPYIVAITSSKVVNDYLQQVLVNSNGTYIQKAILAAGNNSVLASILPFRNHFLKDRQNGLMVASRSDLKLASATLLPAFQYYFGPSSPGALAPDAELSKYAMWLEGLSKLQAALDTGAIFYFPDQVQGTTWPTSNDAVYGVDVDKWFTPGQLSLDQLFSMEADWKAPAIYFTDGGHTAMTFALNGKLVREVFVKGFNQYGDVINMNQLFPEFYFQQNSAELIYDLWHTR